METAEYIFEPELSKLIRTLLLEIGIAILALIMVVWIWKKNQSKTTVRQQLLMMLLGFVVLISLGLSAFSYWSWTRISEVAFYETYLETGYGELKYDEVRNYGIEQKRLGPNNKIEPILIIEGKNGRVHALSAEHYPIKEIMPVLNKKIGK